MAIFYQLEMDSYAVARNILSQAIAGDGILKQLATSNSHEGNLQAMQESEKTRDEARTQAEDEAIWDRANARCHL